MNEQLELFEGHTISIILEKFLKDDATGKERPFDFDGTYSFIIYADRALYRKALVFTESAGVTKKGNQIVAFKAAPSNTLKQKEYYGVLYNVQDANNSFPEAEFSIIVSPGKM